MSQYRTLLITLQELSLGTIQRIVEVIRGGHTFLCSIGPKVKGWWGSNSFTTMLQRSTLTTTPRWHPFCYSTLPNVYSQWSPRKGFWFLNTGTCENGQIRVKGNYDTTGIFVWTKNSLNTARYSCLLLDQSYLQEFQIIHYERQT